MSRTLLTFAIGACVGVGGMTLAQPKHAPGPTVKPLSAVDIGETLDGKAARATALEVRFEPGADSPPHRHPGPVFGYVLEGELDFQAGDQPLKRLKTGETFYEPTMVLHAVARNPSNEAPTRVLAVLLHPRDAKELVIPEPPSEVK